jgi:hypothetical protein
LGGKAESTSPELDTCAFRQAMKSLTNLINALSDEGEYNCANRVIGPEDSIEIVDFARMSLESWCKTPPSDFLGIR